MNEEFCYLLVIDMFHRFQIAAISPDLDDIKEMARVEHGNYPEGVQIHKMVVGEYNKPVVVYRWDDRLCDWVFGLTCKLILESSDE